jgi:hypothetical protein
MERSFRLVILPLVALPASLGAAPGKADQARQPMASEISVVSDDTVLRGDFSPPQYRFVNLSTAGWIRSEDMPADLRSRLLDITSFVAIEVDAAGHAGHCRILRPSSEPRLDSLACTLLPLRGTYPVHRVGPGRPVAVTLGYRVRWETLDAETHAQRASAPLPPPPPIFVDNRIRPGVRWDRAWPRMRWTSSLRPHAIPAIQAAYPPHPGRPREGIVGLDLLVDPERGITGCEIGASSGNPVLDARACEVAQTLVLDYRSGCDGACGGAERLPLQVVWARRGSHIRFPLLPPSLNIPQFAASEETETPRDPADTRPLRRSKEIGVSLPHPPDIGRPVDASYRNAQADYAYEIGPDGVLRSCRAEHSSGNAALDAWLCQSLFQRILQVFPTDVFGNPVPTRGIYRYYLDRDQY